ncbi:MAG: PEP-CTERM sorting domain-containing protein [Pirellula sp.]
MVSRSFRVSAVATIFSVVAIVAGAGTMSDAAVVTYSASDAAAGPTDPRPNSNAMAANFDTAASALGTLQIITFESAPLGAFSNLTVAPGVSLSGVDRNGGSQTIRNTPGGGSGPSDPVSIYGYNTTLGGANFVYVLGGTLTFTFSTGVQAFGAYISGIQFAGETITFNDGSFQSVAIPPLGVSDGGVAFVGFTDAGKSITSITINAVGSPGGPDFISIDDVRIVANVPPVPEPSTFAIVGLGAMGWAAFKRRPKRR